MLGNFFTRIAVFLNILIACTLIGAYLSLIVNPAKTSLFAFLGLAYPVLFILNFIFVIWWVVVKKFEYILISFLSLIVGYSIHNSFFKVSFHNNIQKSYDSISLISYNVQTFVRDYRIFKEKYDPEMLAFLDNQFPDILCLQEFGVRPENLSYGPKEKDVEKLFGKYMYRNFALILNDKKVLKSGMALFSKYPVKQVQKLVNERDDVFCQVCDVNTPKGEIRILNVHLASMRLEKHGTEFFDRMMKVDADTRFKETKGIFIRMKYAYKLRSSELKAIEAIIEGSNKPIVVVGDFNDTPVSYTYGFIKRTGLKDAFISKGQGVSATYRGEYPAFRIDYVFYDNNFFRISEYKKHLVKFADHYPISVEIATK